MSRSFEKTRPYEMRLLPPRNKGRFRGEMVYNFERVKNHEREPDLPTLRFKSPAWIPGIVPPYERDAVEHHESGLHRIFMEKANKGDEEEAKGLYQPKPPKKAKFCGVCDHGFEDYSAHINSEEHLNNMKNNEFVAAFCAESEGTLEGFFNDLKKELAAAPEPSFNPPPEMSNRSLFLEEKKDQEKIEESSSLWTPGRNIRSLKQQAEKENSQCETSERKKAPSVRKIFYADFEIENKESHSQISERKALVEKTLNMPMPTQAERSPWSQGKMPFSGNKSPGGFVAYDQAVQEDSHNRNSVYSSQPSLKESHNVTMVSTDAEPQRESGSWQSRSKNKRKYPSFNVTESEVLNSLKKVKITDDSMSQENTSENTSLIKIRLVKKNLANLASSVKGLIGSFANSISRLWDVSFTKNTQINQE